MDAPVYILFDSDCFSSTCTDALEAACELTVDGATRHVTSTTSWVQTGSRVCTADCRRARSACGSAPLDAGEYTIVFGAATIALAVPSTLDVAPCATLY